MASYCLIDGEEINRKYPETFVIPSLEDRNNVPDNYWVKLGFKTTESDRRLSNVIANGADTNLSVDVERMWVQIDDRESSHGMYYGTLGNFPQIVTGIKMGQTVQFLANNILEITEPNLK